MQQLGISKQIAYGAMCAALSAVCLILAGTLPTMRLAFLFLSSLFVYVLTERGCYAAGVAAFAAAALTGFLIVPNKLVLVPYIALLGHFGIVKPALMRRLNRRWLLFALLMLYCNVCAAAAVFVCVKLLSVDTEILSALPFSPLWLIPAFEAAAAAFIALYSLCGRIYTQRFSHFVK